jgi:hypothetical protein
VWLLHTYWRGSKGDRVTGYGGPTAALDEAVFGDQLDARDCAWVDGSLARTAHD